MTDPGDWLYDPRLTAPEPDSPCLDCGTPDKYHLFACDLHIEAEQQYAEAEDGAPCFICELPKPQHTIGCYRGADYGPNYRKTSADYSDYPEWEGRP